MNAQNAGKMDIPVYTENKTQLKTEPTPPVVQAPKSQQKTRETPPEIVIVDKPVEKPTKLPESVDNSTNIEVEKPKVIIAVHLYGMPYKVDAVRSIANKYEIPILEDSAEALGSTYKGQKCGTFGDIGVLSFNGNKIITTSGGGALVSPTAAVKDKAVFLV